MLTLRPLPSETIDGLRPPCIGFPYFANADHFPFQPDPSEPSLVNAWWLADACFLVYGDFAFIEMVFHQSPLPAQGYSLGWLGTPEDNRGIVLSNEETIVVIFRGTRLQVHTMFDVAEIVAIHQDDLWIDSQFFPAVCNVGGQVHRGFLSAYSDVSDCLDKVLQARRPSQQVWLAGHSLGGALATLAAAHIGRENLRGLYTYGSPRVGDAAFTSVLPERSYVRFVHRDDWVATVPPELLGFVHGGHLYTVPGSPPRRFWEDFANNAEVFKVAIAAMASGFRLKMGDLPFLGARLADHAPIYYATLLWNALAAAGET